MHNTGAGQIGQDLRDDIGTRASERGNTTGGGARRIHQRRGGSDERMSTGYEGESENEREREREAQ